MYIFWGKYHLVGINFFGTPCMRMKYSHKSLLSNHGGHDGIVYTEIDAFCQINLVCDPSQGRFFALNYAIAMTWESITGKAVSL